MSTPQGDRLRTPAKDLLSNPDGKTLATSIDERESQELVIALVGPVGSGVTTSARLLKELLTTDFSYVVADGYQRCQSIVVERNGALIPPYAAETLSSGVPPSVESRAVRFFRIEVFINI